MISMNLTGKKLQVMIRLLKLLLSKPLPARYMEAVNTNFWELL